MASSQSEYATSVAYFLLRPTSSQLVSARFAASPRCRFARPMSMLLAGELLEAPPHSWRVLMRALAPIFNRVLVRWQRRILDRTQPRFLVGVIGLGVDPSGTVLLARHRFGAPQWRF